MSASLNDCDTSKNSTTSVGSTSSVQSSLHDLHLDAFTIRNEEDLQNPSLFSEVYSMAYASACIFALAEVRAAARAGTIEVPEMVQCLPVTMDAVVETFRVNEQKLGGILKEADYKMLKSIAYKMDVSRDGISDDEIATVEMLKNCTFNYFGDDNVENHCVYLIFKNTLNKRITVCFRGSITFQDWIKDSKVFVDDIPNPVADRPDQPLTIGVHLGFKEYLYERTKNNKGDSIRSSFEEFWNSSGSSGGGSNAAADTPGINNCALDDLNPWTHLKNLGLALSKLKEKTSSTRTSENGDNADSSISMTPSVVDNNEDGVKNENDKSSRENEILKGGSYVKDIDKNHDENSSGSYSVEHKCRLEKILEEVQSLYEENDDYSIYITGHSLGGALGLLTSLEAGARFGKPGQPVTYVGIANPRGGTEGFRDAVSVLEEEGKLRCICVHGVHDLVPMIPVSAMTRTTKKKFCQSGVELVLKKNKFEMRYSPKPDDDYIKRVGKALGTAHRISERHHYLTYLRELEHFSEPLRELYLNDYYNKIYKSTLFPPSKKRLAPMIVTVKREGDGSTYSYTFGRENGADDIDLPEETFA